MRTFLIFLAVLLLPSMASAAGVTFTTVFYDDGGQVYVGLKKKVGDAFEAQIITFPYPIGDRVQIPLPDEIVHRDVIGLIPEKDTKLFVITQSQESGKGGPMLHVFDKEKNRWKKIGGIECPIFTKVKLTSRGMTFSCEAGTRRTRKGTKTNIALKTINYGADHLYRNGIWRFPEFMWRYKGVTLLLEGPAPDWDKLRIKASEGERLMSADDLFQLPPPPIAAPAPGKIQEKSPDAVPAKSDDKSEPAKSSDSKAS